MCSACNSGNSHRGALRQPHLQFLWHPPRGSKHSGCLQEKGSRVMGDHGTPLTCPDPGHWGKGRSAIGLRAAGSHPWDHMSLAAPGAGLPGRCDTPALLMPAASRMLPSSPPARSHGFSVALEPSPGSLHLIFCHPHIQEALQSTDAVPSLGTHRAPAVNSAGSRRSCWVPDQGDSDPGGPW